MSWQAVYGHALPIQAAAGVPYAYAYGSFGDAPVCPPGQVADADQDYKCVPDTSAASMSTGAKIAIFAGVALVVIWAIK